MSTCMELMADIRKVVDSWIIDAPGIGEVRYAQDDRHACFVYVFSREGWRDLEVRQQAMKLERLLQPLSHGEDARIFVVPVSSFRAAQVRERLGAA